MYGSRRTQMIGGYDEGYAACPCFWGTEPSSLVMRLIGQINSVEGMRILDAGCGEGKNAAYLAKLGAEVIAVDISAAALANGQKAWPSAPNICWHHENVSEFMVDPNEYDVVIMYGLLHCFESKDQIKATVERFKRGTRTGGYHLLCAFNDRQQDLRAHKNFHPLLLPHDEYSELYKDWTVHFASDSDLVERHPHNHIEHKHSMTRIVAQKPNL